jgi:hypothetical protein
MKKTWIIPVFLAISLFFTLCCACFLLACADPFNLSNLKKSSDREGTFSLVIGSGSISRTILPATVQSDLLAYTLVFSSEDKADVSVNRTNADLGGSVTLAAATWNLTVTAYMDSERTKPAAQGSLTGIVIAPGASVSRNLELKPIIDNGATGTFSWNIDYPADVTTASVKITPLNTDSGTPEQTLYFTGGIPLVNKNNISSPLNLNTGYYQVLFNLSNGAHSTGREEYLHIYKNMDSRFEYTFTPAHFAANLVTNGNNSGAGSLRNAITNAADNSTIWVESGVGTIQLTSQLSTTKKFTLDGNGVTIQASTSAVNIPVFDFITGAEVTVRRVHFTNTQVMVINNNGILNLESCIFSQNHIPGSYSIRNAGALSITGSTFFNNSGDSCGVINMQGGTASLTGNLFYGNTNTGDTHPIVVPVSGTVSSAGYNVVDVPLGINAGQSGWSGQSTDKTVSDIPISFLSFKLVSGRGAANVITSRPGAYPAADFYGNPIPASNAAAGAVQAMASGYLIEVSVNNSALGSAAMSTALTPNDDGLYSGGGTVTFTATPSGMAGYSFQYWQVNNVSYTANPLTITLANHCKVQAVFGHSTPNSVQRVLFSGPSETVTLNGLSNNDIYLVKVNTSGNIVSSADTGGPSGSSSSIASGNQARSTVEALIPRMGHPAADEYHANPPPFERKTSRRSDGPLASSVPLSYAVGNSKSFWVESTYNDGNWIQKTATLMEQGIYGNIWVMDDLTTFTNTQAQALATKFDQIYPIETSLLGYEYGGGPSGDGGWDGDTRIQILVYDIGYNISSTTLGYFWAKDMKTDTGSGQRSNQAEIFYLNGNSDVFTNFGTDALYSTLVHEFQHMINYSRKNPKNLTSATWYNEMLSMLAEDVISPLIGIDTSHSRHPIKSRIPRFLTSYHLAGITEWGSSGNTLDSYAIAYAFGAYLMRNYGGASLLQEMLANNAANIDSVTAALSTVADGGLSFGEALRRYGEALVFSGASMPSDVQSFDKTITETIGSYTYTATEFNIWGGFTPSNPNIFGLTQQVEMRPYSLTVHQAASGWTGQTGNITITLQRPNDPGVEFYLMVK